MWMYVCECNLLMSVQRVLFQSRNARLFAEMAHVPMLSDNRKFDFSVCMHSCKRAKTVLFQSRTVSLFAEMAHVPMLSDYRQFDLCNIYPSWLENVWQPHFDRWGFDFMSIYSELSLPPFCLQPSQALKNMCNFCHNKPCHIARLPAASNQIASPHKCAMWTLITLRPVPPHVFLQPPSRSWATRARTLCAWLAHLRSVGRSHWVHIRSVGHSHWVHSGHFLFSIVRMIGASKVGRAFSLSAHDRRI